MIKKEEWIERKNIESQEQSFITGVFIVCWCPINIFHHFRTELRKDATYHNDVFTFAGLL